MSVGKQNRRTHEFRKLFQQLPKHIRSLATKAFKLWLKDPNHKSLRLHRLKNRNKAKHIEGSYSVSINMQYRAIFFVKDNVNYWYWIGTHADYDKFTGVS